MNSPNKRRSCAKFYYKFCAHKKPALMNGFFAYKAFISNLIVSTAEETSLIRSISAPSAANLP